MVIRYRLKKDPIKVLESTIPNAMNLRAWGIGLMFEAAAIILGFVGVYDEGTGPEDIKIIAALIGGGLLIFGYWLILIGDSLRRSLITKAIVKEEYIEEKELLF